MNKYTAPLDRKAHNSFLPLKGYSKCVYCTAHRKDDAFSIDPECCNACYVEAIEMYYDKEIKSLKRQYAKDIKAAKCKPACKGSKE